MANDNDRGAKGAMFSELKVPGGVIRSMNTRTLSGAVNAADTVLNKLVKSASEPTRRNGS